MPTFVPAMFYVCHDRKLMLVHQQLVPDAVDRMVLNGMVQLFPPDAPPQLVTQVLKFNKVKGEYIKISGVILFIFEADQEIKGMPFDGSLPASF